MNARSVVFVFLAIFAVSAVATNLSENDLFAPLPTVPTTQHQETSSGSIVATQTAPIHAVVDIPEPKPVIVAVPAPAPAVHVVAAVHHPNGDHHHIVVQSIDSAPQQVSDLQFAYSRSQDAAKRAVVEARKLADAAAQSQQDLQAAADRKAALSAVHAESHDAIRKMVDSIARAMDDHRTPIATLERRLKKLKRTTKDVARRLETANRQFAVATAKAEADKRDALQALADAERIAHEKRMARRRAADAARAEHRRRYEEDRKKAHDLAVKKIATNATDHVHSAKVAADAEALTADLRATTTTARDLANRIMQRQRTKALRIKQRLEEKLAQARREVERLNNKVGSFLIPPMPDIHPVGVAVVNGQVVGNVVAHPAAAPQPVAIIGGGDQTLTGAHVVYTN